MRKIVRNIGLLTILSAPFVGLTLQDEKKEVSRETAYTFYDSNQDGIYDRGRVIENGVARDLPWYVVSETVGRDEKALRAYMNKVPTLGHKRTLKFVKGWRD